MRIIENMELIFPEYQRKIQSHYSSTINACSRQLCYSWQGYKKTNPPTLCNKLKMKQGNIIEENIYYEILDHMKEKKIIKDYDKQEKKYIEGETEYPIACKPDAIISLNNEMKIIGECKSGYGRTITGMKYKGKPSDNHINQICLYMYCFDMNGIMSYFARDTGYITEYYFKKENDKYYISDNNKMWTLLEFDINKILEKINKLELYNKHKQLYKREYKCCYVNGDIKEKFVCDKKEYKSDWQCLYCDYTDECWKDIKEESSISKYYGEERIL